MRAANQTIVFDKNNSGMARAYQSRKTKKSVASKKSRARRTSAGTHNSSGGSEGFELKGIVSPSRSPKRSKQGGKNSSDDEQNDSVSIDVNDSSDEEDDDRTGTFFGRLDEQGCCERVCTGDCNGCVNALCCPFVMPYQACRIFFCPTIGSVLQFI